VLLALVALARVGASSTGDAGGALGAADAGVTIAEARPDAGPPETEAARALREGRPMDLNGASAADLELLPRIGPALAGRIVAFREENGDFESVGGLTRVRGIGPRTLEQLRPLVSVRALDAGRPE